MVKSIKRISDKFDYFATKKYIISVFIMTAIVLCFMEKGPFGESMLRELSGGTGMLEMEFGYSDFYVYNMFDNIGDVGRQLYVKLLSLDFMFMVFYTLFHVLVITSLMKKAGLNNKLKILSILPFIRSLLDIIENCFLLIFLQNYPLKMSSLISISSTITIVKLVLNYMIIGIIFLLGAMVTRVNMISRTRV